MKYRNFQCLLSKFRINPCILLVAILFVSAATAQSASLEVGSASGLSGSAVSLPISLNPGSASISTVQFDLMFSSAFTYSNTSTGSIAAAAGKSASANPIAGGVRVLVFGLNATAIGSGVVANLQLNISADAPAGSSPLTVTGIVASDPAANAVALTGVAGSITKLAGSTDTTAPVITGVSSSGGTASGITISWTTNENADTQVQYGTTTSYGSTTALNNTLAVSHSQILTGLTANTLYHYRVLSSDAAGNPGVSADYTFTTGAAATFTLTLPRFAATGNLSQQWAQLNDDNLMGMALANVGSDAANLTFTALDRFGNLISGPGITNPRQWVLNPKAQIGILDSQIFGDAFVSSGTKGWIRVDTTSADVRGFFLAFDLGLSSMDGANFGTTPMTDIALTEIEPSGETRINVANSNQTSADATFSLVRADGTVRGSQTRAIPANGALVADLYGDLFAGVQPDATDYVRMHASQGVEPFELLQKNVGDIASLTGQDVTAGGTTLYSPVYAIGGPWNTTLSILNLDARAGTVMLRFFGEDGVQIGSTRTLPIPALGKLRIDDPNFFAAMPANSVTEGYIQIVSDGVRLAGSTVFGGSAAASYSSALPLLYDLQSSMLFSHVASNDVYFTGIAVMNPNSIAAAITIEVYDASGNLIGSHQESIPAKHRVSNLLTEYVSSLAGRDQTSGYIRVTSNIPVGSFAMFGTNNLSVLSAIPAQR